MLSNNLKNHWTICFSDDSNNLIHKYWEYSVTVDSDHICTFNQTIFNIRQYLCSGQRSSKHCTNSTDANEPRCCCQPHTGKKYLCRVVMVSAMQYKDAASEILFS